MTEDDTFLALIRPDYVTMKDLWVNCEYMWQDNESRDKFFERYNWTSEEFSTEYFTRGFLD